MNYLIMLLSIFSVNIAFATTSPLATAPVPTTNVVEAPEDSLKKPSLGSCDEYSDYYIYKCQAFKCRLSVEGLPNVYREMEAIGYERNFCVFKYKIIVRTPQFSPTDFKMACKLSEQGRLEMAKQFTDYKKGKLAVYANPPSSQILGKECHMY